VRAVFGVRIPRSAPAFAERSLGSREAKRIGVTRQAFIKLRLADIVAPR
jgi:hypothetical protein